MEALLKISLDGGQTFETTEVGGALGVICYLDELDIEDEVLFSVKFSAEQMYLMSTEGTNIDYTESASTIFYKTLSIKNINDLLGKGLFDSNIHSGDFIELVKVV